MKKIILLEGCLGMIKGLNKTCFCRTNCGISNNGFSNLRWLINNEEFDLFRKVDFIDDMDVFLERKQYLLSSHNPHDKEDIYE